MEKTNKQQERYVQMTTAPIGKLIMKLALPTVVANLITSIYNLADTFFVSQINTSASGAVGVVFALMGIIQAFGFLFGIGGSSFVSRCLGQNNRAEAEKYISTAFFLSIGCGLLIMTCGLVWLDELVAALGATDSIAPYARAYAQYILIGAPYMAAVFVLNCMLRAEGNALYSMIGITAGGVLNVALDPLFIFTFGLGTAGAAIATIISQFVSFILLLCFMSGKMSFARIHVSAVSLKGRYIKDIAKVGCPSFFRQALASSAFVFMNFAAKPYGDPAIAALSIVSRIYQFAFLIMIGFGQGYQPVCGYNYGAGLYSRVKKAMLFTAKFMVGFFLCAAALLWVAAPDLIAVFRRADPEVIAIGTETLRYYCIVLPMAGWVTVCNMTSQSTGQSIYATIIALCQQGLFYIPVILTLPRFIGLLGCEISMPLANFLTFLLTIPIGLSILKMLSRPDETLQKGGEA